MASIYEFPGTYELADSGIAQFLLGIPKF